MKTLLKLIMVGCTLLCAFVFLDVLLEDEGTTTTQDVSNYDDNKEASVDNEIITPQVNKKLTSINNTSFKSKVANYKTSTTTCGKNVNSVVVLYSDKYELSIKMINEVKGIVNDYDYNFYSLKLEDGLEVVKAYGLTDVPTLIVATNGKIYTKKGYLSSSDLGSFLNSLN